MQQTGLSQCLYTDHHLVWEDFGCDKLVFLGVYTLISTLYGRTLAVTNLSFSVFIHVHHFDCETHDRGPGLWSLYNDALRDRAYIKLASEFWDNWNTLKRKYYNILCWWDLGKKKSKNLTINYCKGKRTAERTYNLTQVEICLKELAERGPLESEGNVLFNDALNTFYLRLYAVRHMVNDHSDSEKGNPLPPHRLLFTISSKGSFICTIPQTG